MADANTNAAADAAKGAAGAAEETLKKLSSSDSPGALAAIIFAIAIIVFVLVYLVMKFFMNTMKYKTILSNPLLLKDNGDKVVGTANDIPKLDNGRTFTYSFWLYLNKLQTNKYGVLMYQGANTSPNPLFYMDKSQNKMYIRLRTMLAGSHQVTLNPSPTDATKNMIDSSMVVGIATGGDKDTTGAVKLEDDQCYYLNLPIEYVPLERWIHVAVAVDFDVAIVYVDGEVYRVENLRDSTYRYNKGTQQKCLPSGIETISGDIKVGVSDAEKPRGVDNVDGVLSRLAVFNYALTLAQVRQVYNEGPFNQGVMAMLGLPSYGVRNPFYRVNEEDSNKVEAAAS